MAFVFNMLSLLAVCATGAMEWAGVQYSFYWTTLWWDIPTHFLGGLTIGLWAAAVASRLKLSPRRAAFLLLGLAFSIGVSWELWEVITDVVPGPGGFWIDTAKDLIIDTSGAFAAWVLYVLTRRFK